MLNLPKWISNLENEDLEFIRKFILASGSLKEMSNSYDVTYPTMRLKLDRLIEKVKFFEKEEEDSVVSLIKCLAIEEEISVDVAKTLINAYRQEKGR